MEIIWLNFFYYLLAKEEDGYEEKHTYVAKKLEGMMRGGEMMRGSRMMKQWNYDGF